MGLLKWLCKRFSCNSQCGFNQELKGCPKELSNKIENIHNYKLSIEDMLKINKVLKKVNKYEIKKDAIEMTI